MSSGTPASTAPPVAPAPAGQTTNPGQTAQKEKLKRLIVVRDSMKGIDSMEGHLRDVERQIREIEEAAKALDPAENLQEATKHRKRIEGLQAVRAEKVANLRRQLEEAQEQHDKGAEALRQAEEEERKAAQAAIPAKMEEDAQMDPRTADSFREALAGLANLQKMFTEDLNAIVPQASVKHQRWQQEDPGNTTVFNKWLVREALAELGSKVKTAVGKIVEVDPTKRRKTVSGAAGAAAPGQ